MQRTDVNVNTADGVFPSFLVMPDGDGPWPAVIFFMDAGGVRAAMVEMAEQLAGMGYVVLLPEMYYRAGDYEPFDLNTVFTDETERARLASLAGALTKEIAGRDTGAFLNFLA